MRENGERRTASAAGRRGGSSQAASTREVRRPVPDRRVKILRAEHGRSTGSRERGNHGPSFTLHPVNRRNENTRPRQDGRLTLTEKRNP